MAELISEAPSRALAVYAHPDDPEVSCGGVLARWSRAGTEVHVVVATRGDKGSQDPSVDGEVLAEQRAAEVAAAAGVLGLAGVEMLGYLDGALAGEPSLVAELVGVVRRLRPEVVVGVDPTAVFFGDGYVNHVDHRSIGWATLDAVAPAASSPLYFPERGPAHQVHTVLLSGTLEPDVWVDVEAVIDTKVAAMFCHRSQLAPDADAWLGTFVHQRAAGEGRRAGVRYAEGFRRLRLVR
ncbi:MAG: PIG-L family deacetylase [Actinomycetota bacterium]|nr:PIG-L family deacetylase [Actinomycetota bacterium]